MSKTVLLYGATGFSGRLIARFACTRWRDTPEVFRLELAGRNGGELRKLAEELRLRCRVFALDEVADMALGLEGVYAVINAAGPFDATAEPLAKAALRAGAHYVDIAGETDVYKCLDDLGYTARQRRVAVVCGAGHTATVSDVMLDAGLQSLKKTYRELGAIRIAMSRVKHVSRGSVSTSWRAVREEVVVVRDGGPSKEAVAQGRGSHDYRVTHVPTGQLERTFVFGDDEGEDKDRSKAGLAGGRKRMACAVNLIDTLTARLTAARHVDSVQRIESYLEVSGGGRLALQLGAFAAPLLALPGVRALAQRQVDMLPEGPDASARQRDRHHVVLQIDDIFGQPLIDWCLETPNPYDFTATCVVAVVERLRSELAGWRTPAEVLAIAHESFIAHQMKGTPFGGCQLIRPEEKALER